MAHGGSHSGLSCATSAGSKDQDGRSSETHGSRRQKAVCGTDTEAAEHIGEGIAHAGAEVRRIELNDKGASGGELAAKGSTKRSKVAALIPQKRRRSIAEALS